MVVVGRGRGRKVGRMEGRERREWDMGSATEEGEKKKEIWPKNKNRRQFRFSSTVIKALYIISCSSRCTY